MTKMQPEIDTPSHKEARGQMHCIEQRSPIQLLDNEPHQFSPEVYTSQSTRNMDRGVGSTCAPSKKVQAHTHTHTRRVEIQRQVIYRGPSALHKQHKTSPHPRQKHILTFSWLQQSLHTTLHRKKTQLDTRIKTSYFNKQKNTTISGSKQKCRLGVLMSGPNYIHRVHIFRGFTDIAQ